MKCRLVLSFIVAFQCVVLFSTVSGNPAEDDGVDLVAAMRLRRLRKKTTLAPDCSAPCPDDTFLCKSIRDPVTCECGPQNCNDPPSTTTEPPPTTTTTLETTTSVIHCQTEECPPSDFCEGSRNDKCLCEYDCCFPSCPDGQIIDYDHCPSCTNCTCLPDDGATTTEFECNIDCEDHPECEWRIDYDACQCIYSNCATTMSTTTSRRSKRKIVCAPGASWFDKLFG